MTLIGILLLFVCAGAFAIDNPEAPNHLGQLEEKEKAYFVNIESADGYRNTLLAYNDYHEFLLREIDLLTNQLLHKPQFQEVLTSSIPQQWLIFKDKELELIDDTWTCDFSGSSSPIVRGKYKTKVLRDRAWNL